MWSDMFDKTIQSKRMLRRHFRDKAEVGLSVKKNSVNILSHLKDFEDSGRADFKRGRRS